MCPPDFFGVAYVINPWMEGHVAHTNAAEAHAQWLGLKALVEADGQVALLAPRPGLPDLVFTANAGLARGDKVVISRFRCVERRGEEPFFRTFFAERGYEIVDPPCDTPFEGAGDALFDDARNLLWVGHGFRSDGAIAPFLEKTFATRVISLTLVDPRFYHLDTCLCPLPGGHLLYFPGAFDAASLAMIAAVVPESRQIAASETDAQAFCCNAVALGDRIILNNASPALQLRLREAGMTPVVTTLSQFMKAGGAAKCLTLDLG
jgi:N-dimethylarginine dimethylaminohydrolase